MVISDQWLALVYNVVCFIICNKSFTRQDAWEFTSINTVSNTLLWRKRSLKPKCTVKCIQQSVGCVAVLSALSAGIYCI